MATSLAGLQVLLDSYALPCPRYWPASDPLLTASSLHLLLAHARRTRSQPRPPHGRRASSLLLLAGAPRRDALAGTAGAGGAEGDSLVVVGRCDDDFWQCCQVFFEANANLWPKNCQNSANFFHFFKKLPK